MIINPLAKKALVAAPTPILNKIAQNNTIGNAHM